MIFKKSCKPSTLAVHADGANGVVTVAGQAVLLAHGEFTHSLENPKNLP